MSLLSISAKLDRTDTGTPWGFRLAGGADYHAPLSIQRITPGSLASKCGLQVGDAITKIGASATDGMRHKDAMNIMMAQGNSLELTLQRGGAALSASDSYGGGVSGGYSPSQVSRPPPLGLNPVPGINPDSYGNYNRAAAPFAGSAGPSPPGVSSGLSPAARNMALGPPGEDPIPPWRSGPPSQPAPFSPSRAAPAAAAPSPARAPAAPAAAPATSPAGTWRPKVPTGPRQMKAGRAGEARSMGPVGSGGRIPICSFCGISIRGPFVLALDKTWCPEHFCCSNPNCKVPLVGIGFVEEEGQLFCEKDYEAFFAPRCHKCGKSIMRECVNAMNQTYHPECFLCVQCGCQIGQGAFHIEDGKTYCEKHWQEMFQTKCYGCQFPIEPGDRWVEALNDNWHSECFNCSTCQINLEGQAFYAKGGRPYCKKHAMGSR